MKRLAKQTLLIILFALCLYILAINIVTMPAPRPIPPSPAEWKRMKMCLAWNRTIVYKGPGDWKVIIHKELRKK